MHNGYSPAGRRTDDAPIDWPFGQLTELQVQRREEQRRQLERIERRRIQRAADEARRSWQEALL